MSSLRISLFGGVRISHDSWSTEPKMTRAVQALLAYLVLYRGQMHPRDVLLDVFWPESSEERARKCLSTALWRLRTVLEPGDVPEGTYLLKTRMDEIGFNHESDHWLDVAEFEQRLEPVLAKPVGSLKDCDAGELRSALSLYSNELLRGFYDDWALAERERLSALQLKGLTHLMLYQKERGAYEDGLACGRQILRQEPLQEEVHRELMRLYLANGQRAMAIRQYEWCCRVMDEELGITPMEETRRLYHQILQTPGPGRADSGPEAVERAPAEGEAAGLDLVLEELQLAAQQLGKTQVQLQRAAQALEEFLAEDSSRDAAKRSHRTSENASKQTPEAKSVKKKPPVTAR